MAIIIIGHVFVLGLVLFGQIPSLEMFEVILVDSNGCSWSFLMMFSLGNFGSNLIGLGRMYGWHTGRQKIGESLAEKRK